MDCNGNCNAERPLYATEQSGRRRPAVKQSQDISQRGIRSRFRTTTSCKYRQHRFVCAGGFLFDAETVTLAERGLSESFFGLSRGKKKEFPDSLTEVKGIRMHIKKLKCCTS